MFQIVTLLISVVLSMGAVGYLIWIKRDLPVCLSSMVYQLNDAWWWLWTVWMLSVAFTLAPSLIDALPDAWQFVGFLMILCLVVTGIVPLFVKEKEKWHKGFGIATGVLSQVCVLIVCPWWLLVWLVYMLFVMGAFASFNDTKGEPVFLDGKGVFVAEAISALTTYFSLLCVV